MKRLSPRSSRRPGVLSLNKETLRALTGGAPAGAVGTVKACGWLPSPWGVVSADGPERCTSLDLDALKNFVNTGDY